jgi:hypothetical protein
MPRSPSDPADRGGPRYVTEADTHPSPYQKRWLTGSDADARAAKKPVKRGRRENPVKALARQIVAERKQQRGETTS